MGIAKQLEEKIYQGKQINKEEALQLTEVPLDDLCRVANRIRAHFCGNGFDICTIVNGKSGKCSENCKYCAQSSYYNTCADEYPLLDTEKILKEASVNAKRGVLRFSIVTSGKKLSDREVDQVCESFHAIRKNAEITACASHGLLDYPQLVKLREAGVCRYHNNLETSRRNFPNICTTHTYDDKIATIKAAQKAGLSVCSGGIMGLGESMEDRIDMAFDLRELGIYSIPINILNAIPGTPFEKVPKITNNDVCQIAAIYRFINPHASIRLAGGRGLLEDKGRKAFLSGANAAISGDMLTTAGITISKDLAMLKDLGYELKSWNV